MNVIFLTLTYFEDINEHGIYTDLLRKFKNEGHNVYVLTPCERKLNQPTELKTINGVNVLAVKVLNIQKTNVFEKGLGTLLIESQYKSAIKQYFSDVKFDLILYSTPPITFVGAISWLKRRNPQAISYVLLKDIFPQNAVDLRMFKSNSLVCKMFRKKEIALYNVSDYIGCMSPANVDFVLAHNDFVSNDKIEVNPNSLELRKSDDSFDKDAIRTKYYLPTDKPIFIYGGNLGKPQGIDYLIKCLEANKNRTDSHFLIVGSGTEYSKLKEWYSSITSTSVTLLKVLPKEDYDKLVRSCDVGLIFLDHRFTIPNYPSRLLSYMENKMPILAATDVNTDIGSLAEENGYGHWCESNDVENFNTKLNQFLDKSDRVRMGENGYKFLVNNYSVDCSYEIIMKHFE